MTSQPAAPTIANNQSSDFLSDSSSYCTTTQTNVTATASSTQDSPFVFKPGVDSPTDTQPKRFRRKIRDMDAHYVWFLSVASGPLSYPGGDFSSSAGDLFVRREGPGGTSQYWIKNCNNSWDRIYPGETHPSTSMSSYRLHILGNGEPRWVTKKTATTYRGREKRNGVDVRNLLH